MMTSLSWVGLGVVVLVSDALLIWCGYAWCRRRTARAVRESVPVRYIESQISTMNQVIGQLGGCLDTIEKSLESERHGQAPLSHNASTPLPQVRESAPAGKTDLYRIAARFARRGSGVDELMADCGLSRGEAETIANMQQCARGAGAAPLTDR